jgi:iron complex outermembrane receptor protein
LSSTQFRDFVTANGTAAQIALIGTADTDGKMKFTEQLLVQIIISSGGTDNVVLERLLDMLI